MPITSTAINGCVSSNSKIRSEPIEIRTVMAVRGTRMSASEWDEGQAALICIVVTDRVATHS